MIKTGSTICFAQSLIKADDVVIARANATFRVVPKKDAVVHFGAMRSIEPVFVRVFFTRTGIHFARKRYGLAEMPVG